jgi:hypothetical protein
MLDSLVRVSRRAPRVPKAIASQTGERSTREHRGQQHGGSGDGARSVRRKSPPALATGRARTSRGHTPHIHTVGRRSGNTANSRGTMTARTLTPALDRRHSNGSRRPTRWRSARGRNGLTDEAVHTTRERRTSRDFYRPRSAVPDESPLSNFRVPRVYL